MNADCSQCLCDGESVFGGVVIMMDGGVSYPMANVDIFTVGREWTPSAVSGNSGKFTIPGVCVADLKLKARKDGYVSRALEYNVSPRGGARVVMRKLGAFKDNLLKMCMDIIHAVKLSLNDFHG